MNRILTFFLSVLLLSQASAKHPYKYKNPVEGKLPILAWYSIKPDSEQTPERYKELENAGFNLSFSHFEKAADVEKGLKAAEGTNVKLMVTTWDFPGNVEKIVSQFKDNPKVAGWFLFDEPVPADFQRLKAFKDNIWKYDQSHMLYLNLLPNYVPLEHLKTKSYKEYLQRFVDEIDLGFFSFDAYPVIVNEKQDTVLREQFYSNLEDALAVSRQNNEPFWAFALSTAHDPYPVATREMLRLEVFSDLAYGAQGIQYFTYWNPGNTGTWNFNTAPISFDGHRTHVYYLVKELNEEIQRLAPVFLGAEVQDVSHTGTVIPQGTHRLEKLPHPFVDIQADGEGVLVSQFCNKDKKYLMIVNRDLNHAQTVSVKKQGKTMRIENGNSRTDRTKSFEKLLNPGDYILYQF